MPDTTSRHDTAGFSKLSDEERSKSESRWIVAMWGSIGFGLAVVLILGFNNDEMGGAAAAMGGLLLAGASALIGGFIGFLFGIPRSKQGQGVSKAATPEDQERDQRQYDENTNLEQISDWLTKIIVGITLVQFKEIKTLIVDAGTMFAPALLPGNTTVGQAIAVALIIYFAIIGFLFGYMWTRIYMESVLGREHRQRRLEVTSIFTKQKERESHRDGAALELTESYLDPASDPSAPAFANISQKVADASLIARTLIFDRARDVRRKAWPHPLGDPKRALVDRTVPIFQGLIAASPDKNHRNYGQLGYALVKSTMPDWLAAKAALQRAIALRKKRGDDAGTGFYEFNLAIAYINLQGTPEGEALQDEISDDTIEGLLDMMPDIIDVSQEPDVVKWAQDSGYEF